MKADSAITAKWSMNTPWTPLEAGPAMLIQYRSLFVTKFSGWARLITLLVLPCLGTNSSLALAADRQSISMAYMPLANHYAVVVAYEKYRAQMEHTNFRIRRMRSWPLLRGYFLSGKAEMAGITSPLAMDMFDKNPNFRWVSLLHRDGSAMIINNTISQHVQLPELHVRRSADNTIADAYKSYKVKRNKPTMIAVPSILSTHTVVLQKYLQEHDMSLALGVGNEEDTVAVQIAPSKSSAFMKKHNTRHKPAAFVQSLAWAEVIEARDIGRVAWYSRDVMNWPRGHIDSIAVASDRAITTKTEAVREVTRYLHRAARDIESARWADGEELATLANMIQRHIPQHSHEVILQALRTDLNAINYRFLNVEPAALEYIMRLAVEGKIMARSIDIDDFANTDFATTLTE